jgi:hypothetical protein
VKPRLSQDLVLHRETYDTRHESAHRAAYDAVLESFAARQEMAIDTWTRRVINRMGKIAAMAGRDTLAATLHTMGFDLR